MTVKKTSYARDLLHQNTLPKTRVFFLTLGLFFNVILNANTLPLKVEASYYRQLQEFAEKCRQDLDTLRNRSTEAKNNDNFDQLLDQANNLLIRVELELEENNVLTHGIPDPEDTASISTYQKLWDQLNVMQKLLEDATKNCENKKKPSAPLTLTGDKVINAKNQNIITPRRSNLRHSLPRYSDEEISTPKELKDDKTIINYSDKNKDLKEEIEH